MNKTAKGTRIEKKAEDTLKQQGYITWRVRRNKFANMDMFQLFDVVAVCCGGAYMRFIQVKSNRVDKKTVDTIRLFGLPDDCYKEIWVWHDRNSPKKLRGWEIIR